jgi:cellulose synthase (UDP-forming)
MEQRDEVIKVNPPKKSDILFIRCMIVLAASLLAGFVWWFVNDEHIGHGGLFAVLTFALFFKIIKMVHEWYHYWSPSVPLKPVRTREYTVDMLTTACPGEPKDMIIRTLRAMVAVRYPHTNYLCDEGNDPELKRICEELGVVHVTRTIKVDAKAGNINNALKQATGEICIVLDPDHEPVPQFIDQVLPYFEDESIGFVQCVQGYYNQKESFIALGAAEQTYHFYGPMMMCMNTYGTAQAIGANCTFRRKALDSIGGHAAGLSEDMHTAMQLHAKGWKSVYIPEMLTRGLVPATLSSYYKQQLKWSRGTFELLFRVYPKLFSNFTWRQKIHYFTIPLYFLFGLINLIDIAIPLLALTLSDVPWQVNLGGFAAIFLPLLILSMIIRIYAQRWLLEKHERGLHLAGGMVRTATWWIFLIGFIYSLFNVKVPYIPTPKEDEHQNYIRLSMPNLIVILLSGLLVAYGLSIDWTPYSIAMASYSFITAGMLGFTVLMSQQKFLIQVRSRLAKMPLLLYWTQLIGNGTSKSGEIVYNILRNGPLMLLVALSLVFASYSNLQEPGGSEQLGADKELGGFYLGKLTNIDSEKNVNNKQYNVKTYQTILGGSEDDLLVNIKASSEQGSLPFVNFELPAETDAQAFCQKIANYRNW